MLGLIPVISTSILNAFYCGKFNHKQVNTFLSEVYVCALILQIDLNDSNFTAKKTKHTSKLKHSQV